MFRAPRKRGFCFVRSPSFAAQGFRSARHPAVSQARSNSAMYTKSQAQSGRGSVLSIGTSGATPTYTVIGEVKSSSQSGSQWGTEDVTNFESGVDQEFQTTIRDNGELSLMGNRSGGLARLHYRVQQGHQLQCEAEDQRSDGAHARQLRHAFEVGWRLRRGCRRPAISSPRGGYRSAQASGRRG
jgi:hypothetical protein